MSKLQGIFYAMLSSAAFGLMPIFAKTAANNGSNTLTILSLRFSLAFVMLLAYLLFTKTDFKVNKKQLILLLLIGGLGYTSTGLTLFFSYNYIPVGVATTMHFLYPAVVMIFNYFLYKEKITRNKIIALFISLSGVYVLVGIKATGFNLFGSVLAIISAFALTGCVMGMNHPEVKKVSNIISVFYFSLSAGAILIFYTLVTGNFNLPLNLPAVSSIIGISLISTIISIALFMKALKIIGPTSTSILGTFEPIVSIIMGIILFKEKLTPIMAAGTILILLSVIILAKETEKVE
ncbi:MAG: putative Integral rane protein [Clostridiales bacterium]|jgi:drug/metabolite transporter (DMT)-like permease|nr:putative Integral rane protein [Clostridiales bacterium]